MAAFAGGHRQPMVPCFELVQHAQHTLKQADVVLVLKVMVAVTLPQCRVFVFGHIGRGMGQGRHERHADHIRSRFARGLLTANIHHGPLDAAGDDGGGIEQSAVPIESDQGKLAGSWLGHGLRKLSIRGVNRLAGRRAQRSQGG